MEDVCKLCLEKVDEKDESDEESRPKRPKKVSLAKLAAIALLVLLLSVVTANADVTPIPVKLGNNTITPCYIYVVEKPVPYYVTVTKTVTRTAIQVRYIENPAMSVLTIIVPLLAAAGAFAGNILSKRQAEEVKEL